MERRTAIITAAAIAGVILTGATAVAANIGILNRADPGDIGALSAAADVPVTLQPQVIDVYSTAPVPTPGTVEVARDAFTTQTFSVEEAGSVEVATDGAEIRLGSVEVADGWRWTGNQAGDRSLTVTFEGADRTYVFTAELDERGELVAQLEEPIVRVVPAPTQASHDEHDDDYNEHDDEHDEHDDDDEHEGRDDDD